ncbi:MAG: ABC transporter permease [Promethearchaeota archaeon]
MSDQIIVKEYQRGEGPIRKKSKIIRLLKFYLLPGWRDPEFAVQQDKIEMIKSKRRLFRRLITPLTMIGIMMILFIAVLAVFAPWLTRYTIDELAMPYLPPDGIPFDDPSLAHPLGTTKYGYDLLGRLIWGARTALTAAALPVLISIIGGIILGTISAYFGGWVDTVMMRFVDFMYSFPTLILVIIISPMLGNQLYNILIIWGLLYIPANTRFVRSLVLQVKQNLYVRAAVTGGADKVKVMFKHVFPNAISPMIISIFGAMGLTVLGFASIAFLGLGDQTMTDWGTDIMYSRARMTAIGPAFWPGLFIGIAAIGFILIGDGLRDALDPRLII